MLISFCDSMLIDGWPKFEAAHANKSYAKKKTTCIFALCSIFCISLTRKNKNEQLNSKYMFFSKNIFYKLWRPQIWANQQ